MCAWGVGVRWVRGGGCVGGAWGGGGCVEVRGGGL